MINPLRSKVNLNTMRGRTKRLCLKALNTTKYSTQHNIVSNYCDIGITSFNECTCTLYSMPSRARTHCLNLRLTTSGLIIVSRKCQSSDNTSLHVPIPTASVIILISLLNDDCAGLRLLSGSPRMFEAIRQNYLPVFFLSEPAFEE